MAMLCKDMVAECFTHKFNQSIGPVYSALAILQNDAVKRQDMSDFKAEWKKQLDEALKSKKGDPFTDHDPWKVERGAWGNWKPSGQTSSASASSSLPSSAGNQGQECTFQSAWSHWRGRDANAHVAAGTAVQ
jgi:hypothetical protein